MLTIWAALARLSARRDLPRVAPGGMVFHVVNRGVGGMRLFLKDADFEAFERVIEKTLESRPMRI